MKKISLSFAALVSLFAYTAQSISAAKTAEPKSEKAIVVDTKATPAVAAKSAQGEQPTPAEAPPPKVVQDAKASNAMPASNAATDTAYDPKLYVGVPVTDASGKLQYVAENASQTHSKENYVMVRVKGIKVRGEKEKGRVRVAVWDSDVNYAKEGTKPFRASSHWAKDAQNGEMLFKIAGLEIGKHYAFFAHFDKENRGFVKKRFGIPLDPFLFTSKKNQGKGPGLTREGLSPPKFENTVVTYVSPGQEILMEF